MRVYGILKNINKVVKEDCIGVSIDGIQLELNKDLNNEYTKGLELYLDFTEQDYSIGSHLKSFRLKSCVIQVNGDESDLDDNSYLVYNLVRSSKVSEIVISGVDLDDVGKIGLLGSLRFEIGNRVIYLKSNKIKFY